MKRHMLSMLLRILIFACVFILTLSSSSPSPLRAQNGIDVMTHVQRLGNPSLERYSTDDLAYARNVWDMIVFQDRVYLGGGNSRNEPPAPNAGPVDVWYYSLQDQQFVREYTVDDTQIARFVLIDGVLYIPGSDAVAGWQFGNIYHWTHAGWQKQHTIPNALHVYDLARYDGRLFAALGVEYAIRPAVAISTDDGETWQMLEVPTVPTNPYLPHTHRVWTFFELGGRLFASAYPTFEEDPAAAVQPSYRINFSDLLEYSGGGFVKRSENLIPTHTQAEITDLPDGSVTITATGRIDHVVNFQNRVVYIATQVTENTDQPLGLYSVGEGMDVVPHPISGVVRDVKLDGDTLYVLHDSRAGDHIVVSVAATRDLATWTEVLSFTAPTFARSFAITQDDFFFGLGSDADNVQPATGDILTVSRQWIAPLAPS